MNARIVCKTMVNNLLDGRYSFISFDQAVQLTRQWCKRFPRAYDLVVGIPRTGLTIAGIISDEMGIPMAAPDVLPRMWMSSARPDNLIRNILIVEDSTAKGTHLLVAKGLAQRFFPEATVHIGALLVPPSITIPLDTYGERVDGRCILEWEMLHIEYATNIAADLDGVLCREYPGLKTEGEHNAWFKDVLPYKVPVYGLSAIITSRSEQYRNITVDWLRRNGVRYCRLMMDPTVGKARDFIAWKVECINHVMPEIFLESSDSVAKEVHRRTGVPTICVDSMRMYS